MEGLLQKLRTHLHDRHDALKMVMDSPTCPQLDSAWWRIESHPSDCWWFRVYIPFRVERSPVHFRECAEVLVLLCALAQTGYQRFVEYVREASQGRYNVADKRNLQTELGIVYYVSTIDDLLSIHERVAGVEAPSTEFVDDFKWLQNEVLTRDLRPRPIPVRLYIGLTTREQADNLPQVLDKILESVQTQCFQSQLPLDDMYAQAASSIRFEIVEVWLDTYSLWSISVASLESLAKLTTLGVRVPHLPTISTDQLSTKELLRIAQSMHVLLPPWTTSPLPPRPKSIYVYDAASVELVPCMLSAVQRNQNIEEIKIEIKSYDTDEDLQGSWRWISYALFSCDANVTINKISLDTIDFDVNALAAVEQVAIAQNPLATLFETTGPTNHWIHASRFYVENPKDVPDDGNKSVLVTPAPLYVQVIDIVENDDSKCYHVLLPGLGPVWVQDVASIDAASDPQSLNTSSTSVPLDLELPGLATDNKEHILALLQLIPRLVNKLSFESYDDRARDVDVTDWIVDVLRICPHLESLILPSNVKTHRLMRYVEAAEANEFPLRCLSMHQTLSPEASEIVEFLTILSDMDHPLTKRLDELLINVRVSSNDSRGEDFLDAWYRLLQTNRTLHTVTLVYSSLSWLGAKEQVVAIRTGPLRLTSKVAFLSVVQNFTEEHTARCLLDTTAIGIIFSFAAQHRIRKINIRFEPFFS